MRTGPDAAHAPVSHRRHSKAMNKHALLALAALAFGGAAQGASVLASIPANPATHQRAAAQHRVSVRSTVTRRIVTPRRVTQKIVRTCRPVHFKRAGHWRTESSCVSHTYVLRPSRRGAYWAQTW